MSQFITFAIGTEVSGNMVCTLLQAVPGYESKLGYLLSKNNIENPEPNNWYDLQDYLEVFKEISKAFGPNLLFSIGKSIPQHTYQADVSGLENALKSLDSLYQDNHRGGNIGYYKLISFNKERKEARVECKNPYPCYVDRGILTTIAQRFKPKDAKWICVELDLNRPNRLAGADVSYYNIIWV